MRNAPSEMLDRVLKKAMNVAWKYLLNVYWLGPESIKSKRVDWYEIGYVSSKYSCLYSTAIVFSVWFFKHEGIVFHSDHHWCLTGVHFVKNKYWLCLFSKFTKQNFCFIGNALLAFSSIIDILQKIYILTNICYG